MNSHRQHPGTGQVLPMLSARWPSHGGDLLCQLRASCRVSTQLPGPLCTGREGGERGNSSLGCCRVLHKVRDQACAGDLQAGETSSLQGL